MVYQNSGCHFGGPYHKDYNILGPILGSPYSGTLPKNVRVPPPLCPPLPPASAAGQHLIHELHPELNRRFRVKGLGFREWVITVIIVILVIMVIRVIMAVIIVIRRRATRHSRFRLYGKWLPFPGLS